MYINVLFFVTIVSLKTLTRAGIISKDIALSISLIRAFFSLNAIDNEYEPLNRLGL